MITPGDARPLRVVAFGGGTGLSTLLRGLTALAPRVETTAIVAVTDDGGSTGTLRRALGLLAVGDARQCLSATAADPAWARLLEHRFPEEPSLRGHPLGNLVLAAACAQSGLFSESLSAVSKLIDARVRILPMTNVSATLVYRRADGRVARGERRVSRVAGPLTRVWTAPEGVAPAPGVLSAVASADLIVLGPGSLFTSVIAATLAGGLARAISRSSALKVLVQNLTTQRGETDGLGAADHLRALQAHVGPESVDVVLAHRWRGALPTQGIARDARTIASLGARETGAGLVADESGGRLHDPRRLASALYRVASATRVQGPRRLFG